MLFSHLSIFSHCFPLMFHWSSHQNLHRLAHGAMFGFPSVNQPQQTWMIKSQKLAKSKSHQDHEISVNIHQIPIYILRRDFPILMFPKILPILYRISMNFPHVFPHKFDDSSREFAHQKLWMGQRNPAPTNLGWMLETHPKSMGYN